MDSYTIQSYFKLLCKTYCTALKEFKRIKKECEKAIEEYDYLRLQIEQSEWNEQMQELLTSIYKTIERIRRNNIKIVLSSKEEVIVLIYAFSNMYIVSNCKIINDEPKFVKILEGDAMCDAFFMAYASNDDGIMQKLETIYLE